MNTDSDGLGRERLRWQCRRGMLELDYLLERYLDTCFDNAGEAEQQRFAVLLTAQDPELQAWLLNGEPHPDTAFHPLVAAVRGI
ncbi:MAG: succinate dehydrogenase assembly factor 2 [Gammaproteobacteria bacterium]|nr:succinate dehydrogenase assembly factor 2 [Gammaproteobacteria bacterium]